MTMTYKQTFGFRFYKNYTAEQVDVALRALKFRGFVHPRSLQRI